MQKTTVCPACKGRRLLLHLGGMMKECYRCNGVGHIGVLCMPETKTPRRKRERKQDAPDNVQKDI